MRDVRRDLPLRARARVDQALRTAVPWYRARQKYAAELGYWQSELRRLREWFEEGTVDWWGVRPPPADRKQRVSDLWAVNAVMTLHHLRPTYHEELRLDGDAFQGLRVLEVGCGPMAPIQQFSGCERHGLDPLIDLYVRSGWPLYAYDATFVNSRAEEMPYPDDWFDAVISVNALDHVDDFHAVAAEMQRVLRPGGGIYFEVEYHEPTVNEPLRLDDDIVAGAFARCSLTRVLQRGKRQVFADIARRFDLSASVFDGFTDVDRFTTWHGHLAR
jgi:SAM-dependent methyltransferase